MVKPRIAWPLLLVLLLVLSAPGQQRFRLGVFLHHSTGDCIWGPNGGQVTVVNLVTAYNSSHGFSGANAIALQATYWPSADNEWSTWHAIFENRDASNDLRPLLTGYPIVMIKSCFPSANMSGVGSPSDTLAPTLKTVANYKWHWRSIVAAMRAHPQNFFVIWTNAPQVGSNTDDSEARLSDQFCRWAKDTLSSGLDPVVGSFPKNVYVFDFFHKLAGADGRLPLQYATGASDSHPNAAATALVAPQLVTEVLDAARRYESVSGVEPPASGKPDRIMLHQNYPNPFNLCTTIEFSLPHSGQVTLKVVDVFGQEVAALVSDNLDAGVHRITWNAVNHCSGVYLFRLQTGDFVAARKSMLLK